MWAQFGGQQVEEGQGVVDAELPAGGHDVVSMTWHRAEMRLSKNGTEKNRQGPCPWEGVEGPELWGTRPEGQWQKFWRIPLYST